MRKPETIEWLYLDFDGFFASVEQQIQPALRGKPIGVTPFRGSDYTIIIACSKEAKAKGVKNIMPVPDALKVCPELSESIDHLNWRYGKTAVSIGPWDLKYGNHLGTKIAFTRIPRREDAI